MMRAPHSELPIVLSDVTLRAGNFTILDHVSLQFTPGPPTCLIGPNGSGKTSLIRVAMGLVEPSGGDVTWGGSTQTQSPRRAIVFQRPVMLRRSALANITFALKAAGGSQSRKRERAFELLDLVGLHGLAARPARRLSGGEQQRLALARALALDPEVLFLDEPTGSLDPAATKSVEDIVKRIAATGVKVVLSTHDLGQARRLSGDIVLLVRGSVVERAPTEQFFQAPGTVEAQTFIRGDLVL